jgi:hypothetical protein
MANYDKLKVTELRELLQERNLAQNGNKPDLIKRLQENDSAKEAGAAGDAAGRSHFPSVLTDVVVSFILALDMNDSWTDLRREYTQY